MRPEEQYYQGYLKFVELSKDISIKIESARLYLLSNKENISKEDKKRLEYSMCDLEALIDQVDAMFKGRKTVEND